jgi:hypothetical protein
VKLLQIVETTTADDSQIAVATAQIRAAILSQSRYIDAANFSRIHPSDLEFLFSQYDAAFFAGKVKASLGATPLHFKLSRRMTSAGGKTVRYTDRQSGSRHFEIGVSTTILFGCFHDVDHRPVTASGIVCQDRLDALQRVMEHEMVHLIEMLLWDESSCARSRFQSITRRFFGHTENMHQLITPRERAIVKFGIRPGMKVRFRFEGAERTGIVNRISKRATVLVEDDRGQRYTNGKHYAKFYVPVQSLEAAE